MLVKGPLYGVLLCPLMHRQQGDDSEVCCFSPEVPPLLAWQRSWCQDLACYISVRFLLWCVHVSGPSVALYNICECVALWLLGSCANTVWVIWPTLDVVCQ